DEDVAGRRECFGRGRRDTRAELRLLQDVAELFARVAASDGGHHREVRRPGNTPRQLGAGPTRSAGETHSDHEDWSRVGNSRRMPSGATYKSARCRRAQSGWLILERPHRRIAGMPFSATVLRLMIASPGDVETERGIVRDVVNEWNSTNGAHRNMMLLTVGWETDVAPEMGDAPQSIIDK